MAFKSSIEWTDASWNPVTGCTKIGAGCDNCYAATFAERFRGVPGHPYEVGFDLTLRPERLDQPLTWRKPMKIFVNSMSDLFHKDIPLAFVDRVFDTMERAHWHIFQVLTKRSTALRDYVNRRYGAAGAPSHIWFGVSVENRQAMSRIAHLLEARVAVRFLSVEPLLEDLVGFTPIGMNLVIVGGESGNRARPMRKEWAIRVRDACLEEDVPFFFKQWGKFGEDGRRWKDNNRLLEGREWNQFPEGVIHVEEQMRMPVLPVRV